MTHNHRKVFHAVQKLPVDTKKLHEAQLAGGEYLYHDIYRCSLETPGNYITGTDPSG